MHFVPFYIIENLLFINSHFHHCPEWHLILRCIVCSCMLHNTLSRTFPFLLLRYRGDKNTGMNNPPEIHVTFANNNNVEELDSSTTTTTRESSKKREIRTAVITEFTDDDSQIDEEGTRTILSTTTVTEISNKNDTDHLSNTHDDPSHMTSPTSADVTASSVTGDTFNVTPDVQSPSSPTSSLTSSTPSVKKPGPPIIRLQRSPR